MSEEALRDARIRLEAMLAAGGEGTAACQWLAFRIRELEYEIQLAVSEEIACLPLFQASNDLQLKV